MADIVTLTTGMVTCQVAVTTNDGSDEDSRFDAVAPQGWVYLRPRKSIFPGGSPSVAVIPDVVSLVVREDGWAVMADQDGAPVGDTVVELPAVEGMTWQVSMDLSLPAYPWQSGVERNRIRVEPFDIPVEAGKTTNIADYLPLGVDPGTGATWVKGDPGKDGDPGVGVVSVRAIDGQAIFTLSDGTDLAPIPLPKGNDGAGLPTGGSTNQVPARTSDGGAAWKNVSDLVPVAGSRTQLLPNPTFVGAPGPEWVNRAGMSYSVTDGVLSCTYGSTVTNNIPTNSQAVPVAPGLMYTVAATIKNTGTRSENVYIRFYPGSDASDKQSPQVTLAPGEEKRLVQSTATPVASSTSAQLYFYVPTFLAGSTKLAISKPVLEPGVTDGSWFTGSGAGLMSAADKTKLDAAATAASVTSGDASTLAAAKSYTDTQDTAVKSWASDQDGAVQIAAETRDVSILNARSIPLDGTKWLIVGDSIATLGISSFNGQHYSTIVPAMSAGRLTFKYRTAVAGHTSAQQLSTLTTHLNSTTDYTMATVMVGTNDLSQGIAMATWQSNVQKIVTLLRSKGIEPVLFTVPPRSGPTNPVGAATIQDTWNAWLKSYCTAQGITWVDIWAAVADPATREWRAGYVSSADGVHPTPVGQAAMSEEIWRTLSTRLRTDAYGKGILAPQADADYSITPASVVSTAGNPTGWSKSSTGVTWVPDGSAPGGYAGEIIYDSSTSGTRQVYMEQTITSGFTAGDTLRIVARAKVLRAKNIDPGSGMKLLVRTWQGSTNTDIANFIYGVQAPSQEYRDYNQEITAPAGTTALSIYWQVSAGAATGRYIHARLGGIGVYNLTNLGL